MPKDVKWHTTMKRSKRKALELLKPIAALQERLEQVKSSIRAKVEHPFRVIKRQFGHVKTRYRGSKKNTQQLHTLFAGELMDGPWALARIHGLDGCGEGLKDKMPARRGHLEQPSEL